MINSQTLKTFVKMHEYKLDAKINALRANRLHNHLEQAAGIGKAEPDRDRLNAGDNRYTHHFDQHTGRRRPKSRYFNFIVTATRH